MSLQERWGHPGNWNKKKAKGTMMRKVYIGNLVDGLGERDGDN